jgi:hypothetical protein
VADGEWIAIPSTSLLKNSQMANVLDGLCGSGNTGHD